jgi:hypothetical protein
MTIVQTTGKNMSGSKKRLVHQAARNVLTQYLAGCDALKGDRLVDSLDRFQARLGTLLDECSAAFTVAPPKSSLLEFVTTVDVVGIDEFVARDKFREGKTVDGVKIYWIGGNFKINFDGKTEKDIAPAILHIHKLKKNSVDRPIRNNVGADNEETALSQFWELLKKQGQGQAGALLVNGWANIFYIRDQNGTLWAVRAFWYSGGGWYVEAASVTSPVKWSADRQVVSR